MNMEQRYITHSDNEVHTNYYVQYACIVQYIYSTTDNEVYTHNYVQYACIVQYIYSTVRRAGKR